LGVSWEIWDRFLRETSKPLLRAGKGGETKAVSTI